MDRHLLERTGSRFDEWQRGIIFQSTRHGKWTAADPRITNPIRKRQEELQAAISAGAHALSAYLRKKLQISQGELGAPRFPRPRLTPREFQDPPLELEEELGKAWIGLRTSLTSQPLFWLLCHIDWLEQGRFDVTGHHLAEAFTAGHGDTKREARTRNFLRRTSGLPVARGNTSVFSDCLMARSWWRYHLADQVEKVTAGRVRRRTAHRVLHTNRPAWEELIMRSLRRITVINQPRARAAIVHQLASRLESRGHIDKKDVQGITLVFARQGLRRSFEHTSWEDLTGGSRTTPSSATT